MSKIGPFRLRIRPWGNFWHGEFDFQHETVWKPKKQTKPPNVENKKTAAYKRDALTFAKNRAKWDAAEDFCEDRQMNFMILTEDHLGV